VQKNTKKFGSHFTRFSWIATPALALVLALGWCASLHAQALATQVDRFEVQGNTLLRTEAIDKALAGLRGRMTLLDIQGAAQRLQAAYRRAGYGAVVVQVPVQTLVDGVVRLEVIEGRLSQVQVAGLRAFSRENILSGLPALKTDTTPDLAALDSELLMVNENPAKSVRVVFQPGEKNAQVESLVVVEEQPIERWQIGLDNTGNESTGQYRAFLGYQHANVADSDSVLGLRLITSPEDPSRVAIASASLRTPLYEQKLFLEWSALASNTRNTPNQTAAGELRFSGEGYSVGARAIRTLPTLGEYKQQVSGGVENRQYKNNCSLGAFGAAGCGSAAASVEVFPLTLGYLVQKPGTLQAAAQYVYNLPLGNAGSDADFNAARPGANSRYQLVRFNGAGLTALTAQLALSWRLDTQYTEKALVSAEQFGAGGANSVRGYPERALSGDSGAVASLEVRTLATQWVGIDNPDTNLYASVFADAGTVSNLLGTACVAGRSSCSLWGAGVGLLWRQGKSLTLRTDVARAGESINDTKAGDWRLHFSLVYVI
jgi:hemolysin activation/secretion protein